MKKRSFVKKLGVLFIISALTVNINAQKAHNPIIWADVPDMSMIRVDDIYYMSSTTMHMNPGTPIMKSKNLVDWEMASYTYGNLGKLDAYELENSKYLVPQKLSAYVEKR